MKRESNKKLIQIVNKRRKISQKSYSLAQTKAYCESLAETTELLSTPGLRAGLKEAKRDIRAGRTKPLASVFSKPQRRSDIKLIEKGQAEYKRGKGVNWRSVKRG